MFEVVDLFKRKTRSELYIYDTHGLFEGYFYSSRVSVGPAFDIPKMWLDGWILGSWDRWMAGWLDPWLLDAAFAYYHGGRIRFDLI